MAGPVHAAWEPPSFLEPRARERRSLAPQRAKTEVRSLSGNYGSKPTEVKTGNLAGLETGKADFGILGGGLALGDGPY